MNYKSFGFGIDKIGAHFDEAARREVVVVVVLMGKKNSNNVRNNAILMHYLMRCAFICTKNIGCCVYCECLHSA